MKKTKYAYRYRRKLAKYILPEWSITANSVLAMWIVGVTKPNISIVIIYSMSFKHIAEFKCFFR